MPPEMAALLQQTDFSAAPHSVAIARSAHVGGFGLTEDIIKSEPAVFQSEWMPLPVASVPDAIEELPELRKDRYGNLTTVEEGDQPTNGDVMIKYEYCADGFDTSFIVQQVMVRTNYWDVTIFVSLKCISLTFLMHCHTTFNLFQAESDPETGVPAHKYSLDKQRVLDEKCCGKISDDLGVIWMVRRGRHDVHEMISMAKEDENNLTKILRVLCWILIVAGWMMLFSIFTTLLNTLPIIGQLGSAAFFIVALIVGTVCCCGVTAIAYMRYRPLISFTILAIAGGIAGIIVWRLNAGAEASTQPTSAPVKAPRFYDEAIYDYDTELKID